MTDAQGHTFDWPGAIARNRDALLRIVAVLFVYAGLDEGGADTVPRRVWRMILRLLRPAESAGPPPVLTQRKRGSFRVSRQILCHPGKMFSCYSEDHHVSVPFFDS